MHQLYGVQHFTDDNNVSVRIVAAGDGVSVVSSFIDSGREDIANTKIR